jgi:hypothetical protein
MMSPAMFPPIEPALSRDMRTDATHRKPAPDALAANGHAQADPASPPLQPGMSDDATGSEAEESGDDDYDPLAPIKALSYEERIALFS